MLTENTIESKKNPFDVDVITETYERRQFMLSVVLVLSFLSFFFTRFLYVFYISLFGFLLFFFLRFVLWRNFYKVYYSTFQRSGKRIFHSNASFKDKLIIYLMFLLIVLVLAVVFYLYLVFRP